MVQVETNLVVADNSGARSVRIFRIYGGTRRRTATVGDIVQCAVKDAIPNAKVKKGDVVKAVIVRTAYPLERKDGSTIKIRHQSELVSSDQSLENFVKRAKDS